MKTINSTKLTAVIAVLLLTACGGSGDDEITLETTSPTESNRSESRSQGEQSSRGSGEVSEPTGKVTVTSIEKDGYEYDLVLNGVLGVRNAKIRDGQHGEWLQFPQRKSGEKYWNYIRIGRGDADLLLTQVKENAPKEQPSGFDITAVEVNPRPASSGNLRAYVEFTLNDGAVILESWKLIEGSKGLFLGAPSENIDGEWVDLVYALDKGFRDKLQAEAIKVYEAEVG